MSKGARSRAEIDVEHLAAINRGEVAARTLAEGLAVDFPALLARTVPGLPESEAEAAGREGGITARMARIGSLLADRLGLDGITRFLESPSDTVRGWAAYLVAALPDLPLNRRLDLIRPLADDPHFGVREWAWLALRPRVAEDVDAAIVLLGPWTAEASPNLRRFAVEIARPRGVWCAHLPTLKADPAKGLPLLEPLRADPARYVQDSVANWLNDAAKSRPDWVRDLTRRWLAESDAPATARITRRALRSLKD